MRAFGFGRGDGQTHKRRDRRRGRKAHAGTGATAPRVQTEPVDRQIESLLVSLEQPSDVAVRSTSPSADEFAATARERRARRAPTPTRPEPGRRPKLRRSLRARVDRFDLYFVLGAVVLGVAVGILTTFLLNS